MTPELFYHPNSQIRDRCHCCILSLQSIPDILLLVSTRRNVRLMAAPRLLRESEECVVLTVESGRRRGRNARLIFRSERCECCPKIDSLILLFHRQACKSNSSCVTSSKLDDSFNATIVDSSMKL